MIGGGSPYMSPLYKIIFPKTSQNQFIVQKQGMKRIIAFRCNIIHSYIIP